MRPSIRLVLSALLTFNAPAHAASVATSSPESTDAAIQILSQGGNAIDAACAAFFVQSVTQSYFTGVGGGGFATLDVGGKVHHYDFREVAPLKVKPDHFAAATLNGPRSWGLRNTGGISVGVPGNIAGCNELVKHHGKKKWSDVIAPAIAYAKKGFAISKMYEEELTEQWGRIRKFELTRNLFKGKSGKGAKKGEVIVQPELAQFLEQLSNEGSDSFYRGKLAKAWTAEASKVGVLITPEDLSRYQVISRNPISFDFGPFTAVTAAPSSAAGLMVGAVLRFLDHYHRNHGIPGSESIARKIIEIETIHHFGQIRNQSVADPEKTRFNFSTWFGSRSELASWGELDRKIQKRLSTVSESPVLPSDPQGKKKEGASHTSNISVLDDQGNAMALTTSVGEIFGSGITVPRFGILLNSTLGDFSTDPKDINAPGPGLRPRSNISPTLVYQKTQSGKKLVAVLGAAGGPLIPQSIVQFFMNYFVHGMDADTAIRSPRIGVSYDGSVEIEKTTGKATFEALKKAGYSVDSVDWVWAVFNGIVRKNPESKWEAVSESRYDGKAWSN